MRQNKKLIQQTKRALVVARVAVAPVDGERWPDPGHISKVETVGSVDCLMGCLRKEEIKMILRVWFEELDSSGEPSL